MTDPVSEKETMAREFLRRLEIDLIPKLKSPKGQLRSIVAVHVLTIVERQIGRGEGPLNEEWDQLREVVKNYPKASQLIEGLHAAISKYEEDLLAKVREAEADEEQLRKAAYGVIASALMAKLNSLKEQEAEEDAKFAEAKPTEAAPADAKPLTALKDKLNSLKELRGMPASAFMTRVKSLQDPQAEPTEVKTEAQPADAEPAESKPVDVKS